MMRKCFGDIAALLVILTCVAEIRTSAQPAEVRSCDVFRMLYSDARLLDVGGSSKFRGVVDSRYVIDYHCAYIDYLNRPKKTGLVEDLLGPIEQVKNGPYAAWTTKIAYLTVNGSMKFQSSPLVKDTWKLYSSTYDHYDFVLGQEANRLVTFRLSGTCSMNGMKVFDTDRIAHCYNVALKPEAVLNRFRWHGDGNSALTLSAMAGPEVGVLFSIDNWILQARFYAGVTSAVRIDYTIADRLCLYFEPRFSYVPYTLRNLTGNRPATSINRFGSVVRLNIGMRVSF